MPFFPTRPFASYRNTIKYIPLKKIIFDNRYINQNQSKKVKGQMSIVEKKFIDCCAVVEKNKYIL
jgi:hypothetical protein